MHDSPKIDFARCPMWWHRVIILLADGAQYLTFVRAADFEAATHKAATLIPMIPGADRGAPAVVCPVVRLGVGGVRRREFAGYCDE